MKRLFYTILLFAYFSFTAQSQSVVERVFLSTDKENYVAGEGIWLSGFSFKIENGQKSISDISAIMYIELITEKKSVVTLKMAMKNGRGSACADLPLSLATGVYTLVAYTDYMQNENPLPCFEKKISIYNTLTSERLPGVKVGSYKEKVNTFISAIENNGPHPIDIVLPSRGMLKKESAYEIGIQNLLNSNLSASISIYKRDSLPVFDNINIETYLKGNLKEASTEFSGAFVPEFEGEIIKGRVVPTNGTSRDNLAGMNVFLSVPRGEGEIYTSVSDKNGDVLFFTNNIFGKRECVLEVIPMDTTSRFAVELTDPFLHPTVTPVNQLTIDPSFKPILEERSFGMQILKSYGADLVTDNTIPVHNPFLGGKKKTYLLDDYTRFPVMEEVIIEYVTELRYRKSGNRAQMHIRWDDSFNSVAYSRDNNLVLIDGIPVFDHKKILEYDPLKIKSISIYGDRYYIGNLSYTGIASFKTYTGKYQGLTFDKNVYIVDFIGAQPISRLTGSDFNTGKYPDFRHTIFWEPIASIPAAGTKAFKIRTPSINGEYIIVVQGVTDTGTPLFFVKDFSVE